MNELMNIFWSGQRPQSFDQIRKTFEASPERSHSGPYGQIQTGTINYRTFKPNCD